MYSNYEMAHSKGVNLMLKFVTVVMESFDIAQLCFESLSKYPDFFPNDPYRLILHIVRRREGSQMNDIQTQENKMSSNDIIHIPKDVRKFHIQPILGTGKLVGLTFLSQLLEESSISWIEQFSEEIRINIGNLPSTIQQTTATSTSTCTFIPVHIIRDSVLSNDLVIPSYNLAEVVVEVLIKSKSIEDSLYIFSKRVVDEIYNADSLPKYSNIALKITMSRPGQSAQIFQASAVRSNPKQVLSAIKGAVIDCGEIKMEFLQSEKRNLGDYLGEETTGYRQIVRRYHLTYIHPDNGTRRCFSKIPCYSLVRGVFSDQTELVLSNMVSLETHTAHKNSTFSDYISTSSKHIVKRLEEGELVSAAIESLLLQALLLSGPEAAFSSAGLNGQRGLLSQQLSALCKGTCGHLKSARDLISNIRSSISFLLNSGKDLDSYRVTLGSDANDSQEEFEKRRTLLTERYRFLPDSLKEMRMVLIHLMRDVSPCCSELYHLQKVIYSRMQSMFDPRYRHIPIIPSNLDQVSHLGILAIAPTLMRVDEALHYLESLLHIVELSVGMDVLLDMFEMNLNGSRRVEATPSYSFWKPKQKRGREVQSTTPVFEADVAPYNLTEFFGYVQAQSGAMNASWSPVQTNDFVLFLSSSHSREKDRSGLDFSRYLLDPNEGCPEDILALNGSLWDVYPVLCVSGIWRDGRIPLLEAEKEEVGRMELPKCIGREVVRLRYFCESYLYRGFQEGYLRYLQAPLHHQTRPVSVLTRHLFSYSAFTQLWSLSDDDVVNHVINAPLPWRLKVIKGMFGGAKFTLEEYPDKLMGGLVAHKRILRQIGDLRSIYRDIWMLPPMLPSSLPNLPAGVSLDCHCGLSAISALRLGYPCDMAYQPLQRHLTEETASYDLGSGYPGHIVIELVMKSVFDHMALESRIRQAFGARIMAICEYMLGHTCLWKLLRIVVDGRKFSVSNLTRSGHESNEILEACMSSCEVILETAVLIPDTSKRPATLAKVSSDLPHPPSFEELIDMLERLAQTQVPVADRGNGQNSPSPKDGKRKLSQRPRKVSKLDSQADVTSSESSRIFTNGPGVSLVQTVLGAVENKIFVPCQIHCTLVGRSSTGSITPGKSQKQNKIPTVSLPPLALNNRGENDVVSPEEAKLEAEFRNCNLCFCSLPNLARLVASTVWLSSDGASSVWEFISRSEMIDAATAYESNEHMKLAEILEDQGRYSEANEHLWLTAILRGKAASVESITNAWRMHIGLPGRLSRLTDCVRMLKSVIREDDHMAGGTVSIPTVHLIALARTIHSHFWCNILELLVFDPQAIHLRGGCLLILRAARRVMEVLGFRKSSGTKTGDEIQLQAEDLHSDDNFIMESIENRLRVGLSSQVMVEEVIKNLKMITVLCDINVCAYSKDVFEVDMNVSSLL